MTNKKNVLNNQESIILIDKLANAKKSDNIYTVSNITELELKQLEYFMFWNHLELMNTSKLENGVYSVVKYKESDRYKYLFESI